MNCGDNDLSPQFVTSYHDGPYNASLASSASSSTASVWSDASSQSSDDSSVHSSITSDPELSDSHLPHNKITSYQPITNCIDQTFANSVCWSKNVLTGAVPEQRQNPRRTGSTSVTRSGCPPSLVRQSERKVNFVDSLVDSSTQIVEAIWPLSSVSCRIDTGSKGVLPLRTFIQETLRRSRSSYSTLQVALYYLILIKPHVPKHDFTMEQPEDAHSIRALQCGRRMFLAALILASKYLQDRNYSARAWSKISGLNTQEINQNEMAFLLAVNWKLHITDAVFQRWADIVLKYTPSQPPSPGTPSRSVADQSASWKAIILKLNPELDNLEDFSPVFDTRAKVQSMGMVMPTPILERQCSFESGSNESTPTPRYYTPSVMEPSPSASYPSVKAAPALGLLPTPRLTPTNVGFNTPAVSAASYMLGKSSMCYAMAQASSACAAQLTDKWPTVLSPLAVPGCSLRRSSLANSVSSMSSPESMISDTSSRSSRSSSISSASSMMCAPVSMKLDIQARCRYAKQCCDRQNNRTIIAAVPENFTDRAPTSSPDSYTGIVGKDLLELSLDTPLASQNRDTDYFSRDSVNDAARALQELHNNPRLDDQLSQNKVGLKRSRPVSMDNPLQDNVRDLLAGKHSSSRQPEWTDNLVQTRKSSGPVKPIPSPDGRKRICCSTEASEGFPEPQLLARPGMWQGIL